MGGGWFFKRVIENFLRKTLSKLVLGRHRYLKVES
jgi:hypothetical protein